MVRKVGVVLGVGVTESQEGLESILTVNGTLVSLAVTTTV
jgi:hypothetical protein